MLNLYGGQVDGQPEVGVALLDPAADILAGLVENTLTELAYQFGFLRQGQEVSRVKQSPLRVLPANQGLKTHDPVGC